MPAKTPVIDCLKDGNKAFGVWNTIPGAAVARAIASTPQISWVLIDAEHGQINDTHLYGHTTAIAAAGRSPIIRVPDASTWWAKRALDAGAHGIVYPLSRTADEVRMAVAAARYPSSSVDAGRAGGDGGVGSNGVRGYGPMYAAHAFGEGCTKQEYMEVANKLLVIIQIETREAIENLEDIAKIDGVDVLFIGPYDLSLNLGIEFGSNALETYIGCILDTARKYGKKTAIYCSNGEQARRRAEQGFDMVSIGADISVLERAYASEIEAATGRHQATE